jgi:hypothetical protein
MTSFQSRKPYDHLYETTREAALTWPMVGLAISLELLMHKGAYSEEWWGAIDAVTDLLGKRAPPVWREEFAATLPP